MSNEATSNPALIDGETYAIEGKRLVDDYRQACRASGLTGRWRGNWNLYYSRDDGKAGWGDNLYAEGDSGERVRMQVNVARNLIQHILALTISTRPVVDPKAINTDAQSIKQVEIARSVADHYLKTEKVYEYVDDATETGLVMTAGFVHGWWDETAGGIYTTLPNDAPPPDPTADPSAPPPEAPPPTPVYRGDVSFSVLTPLDVYFDTRASSWRDVCDVIVREWKDKYETSARYPASKEKIEAQPTRDMSSFTVVDNEVPAPTRTQVMMRSNAVEVFTRYYKPSPLMPQGRRCVFVADGTLLEDGPLPYKTIPLWRIAPAKVIGTPFSWSPLTSMAPMQESLNKAMSAIATRVFSHSTPNVLVKRGANVEPSNITGGQNFLEYDDDGSGRDPVKLLEMMEIPDALMNFVKTITQYMESDSGVNAVVRGNPPNGMTAGVAIAQFESMAVQFSSRLEASYAEAIEDMVMWIFEALKTHSASMPRMIQLVGRSKHEALHEFYGSDLEGICRVVADMGNPLSRTVAGRMQIADALRNSGIPMTPEQYLEVMNTGTLESATEGTIAEMDLIRMENEKLMNGEAVTAMLGDADPLHIREHMAVLANPDIRFTPIVQVVQEHIQQHVQKHMQGDVTIGIMMGMIPPGAAQPPPPAPGGPPGPSGHGAAAPPPPPHGAAPGGPAVPPHPGPPQMHAPPPRGPPPGALPRVLEPQPLAPH